MKPPISPSRPSGLIETRAEIVLDASAALRALLDSDEGALAWLRRIQWGEIGATWPELALVEIANGLRTDVHARVLSSDNAIDVMARAMAAPIEAVPLAALVPAALEFALARSLTAYDACYAVLAEMLGATLVTADRRLAAAVSGSVLV